MNKYTLNERIKLVSDNDMSWDWSASNPVFNTKTPDANYGHDIKFDPFPCYSHKRSLVLETLQKAEEKFPIGFDVFYFIFSFEPTSRTNGCAYRNTVKYGNKEKGIKPVWDGVVDLYGKRIPIHPRMTKYIAIHEYSHHIDNWICHCKGLEYNGLDEEYAKMRGLKLNQEYGGRKWHTNIGEIIANDCRIAVFDTEPEFWPHECKHPNEDDNVKNWWYEAMISFSAQNNSF